MARFCYWFIWLRKWKTQFYCITKVYLNGASTLQGFMMAMRYTMRYYDSKILFNSNPSCWRSLVSMLCSMQASRNALHMLFWRWKIVKVIRLAKIKSRQFILSLWKSWKSMKIFEFAIIILKLFWALRISYMLHEMWLKSYQNVLFYFTLFTVQYVQQLYSICTKL